MLLPSGRGPPRGLSVAWPWDRTTATESAGFGDMPLSPKKMYVALGGATGKGHIQGAWGERGEIKTNRLGKHIRSLSQQLVGYMMHEKLWQHRNITKLTDYKHGELYYR